MPQAVQPSLSPALSVLVAVQKKPACAGTGSGKSKVMHDGLASAGPFLLNNRI